MSKQFIANSVYMAVAIALAVILLGAYVRLSDAGLSCPDWPGCYGQLLAPSTNDAVANANLAYPDTPVEVAKAWKEMVHRYLAGLLGLVIVFVAWSIWRHRQSLPNVSVGLALGLVGLVLFQAALGMWTVTQLLKPLIVTAHLLGGLATLSLLWWLALSFRAELHDRPRQRIMSCAAVFALLVLCSQLTLGGWTSTNYAALSCPDFPTCHGSFWPPMDFAEAFNPWRELGRDSSGNLLNASAMTAIQWLHRVGALITVLVLGGLAIVQLFNGHAAVRKLAVVIMLLLLLQVGLGIANVLTARPLLIAVAHNGVGALLLLAVITQFYVLRGLRPAVSDIKKFGVQSDPPMTA